MAMVGRWLGCTFGTRRATKTASITADTNPAAESPAAGECGKVLEFPKKKVSRVGLEPTTLCLKGTQEGEEDDQS